MGWHSVDEPVLGDHFSCEAIETLIGSRSCDLASLAGRQARPSAECRMVGSFVLFGPMGASELLLGQDLDVRSHPYVRLSTVSYLIDGEIKHRDTVPNDAEFIPLPANSQLNRCP
jgi:redox-sensitive bicupin YhaK (pirin superfamily)